MNFMASYFWSCFNLTFSHFLGHPVYYDIDRIERGFMKETIKAKHDLELKTIDKQNKNSCITTYSSKISAIECINSLCHSTHRAK